jgi:hypothetical protein
MIEFSDTIVVKMSSKALQELESCEYGSYEDHIHDDGVRDEPYDKGRLHIVEIIQRSTYKNRVYLQSSEEVEEFFHAACTGTFGLYHLRVLRYIYKQLLPFVSTKTRARISYGSLGY